MKLLESVVSSEARRNHKHPDELRGPGFLGYLRAVGKAEAYIARSISNAIRDHLRDERSFTCRCVETVEGTYEGADDLLDLLESMIPHPHEVVRLRVLEDLTLAEIGRRLGLSESGVHKILKREACRFKR